MKKILLFFSLFVFVICSKAQVTVAEPDFAEQTIVLTSDSEGVLLPRESGAIKAKAAASLYLTGIGKVKSRITLDGNASKVKVAQQNPVRFIVRGVDNLTDPKSFISFFKFEVKKKKLCFLLPFPIKTPSQNKIMPLHMKKDVILVKK